MKSECICYAASMSNIQTGRVRPKGQALVTKYT